MLQILSNFLPNKSITAKYPGLPVESTSLGIEVLLRLGDLIEFMLSTFANLVTDAQAPTTEVAREKATFLLQPTYGVFARELELAFFGGGPLGADPTVTLFELFTGCYDLPGLLVPLRSLRELDFV